MGAARRSTSFAASLAWNLGLGPSQKEWHSTLVQVHPNEDSQCGQNGGRGHRLPYFGADSQRSDAVTGMKAPRAEDRGYESARQIDHGQTGNGLHGSAISARFNRYIL